jgi:RNA polymerase sigma-70 factor (ECF subfamily)
MDQSASELADLVERYYALLYRYACRLTGCVAEAEDLTQHAFLTAHAKWHQLQDKTKAKSWLFTIARNAYLKELRGPTSFVTAVLDAFPAPSVEPSPTEFDSERLQNVLNTLPEEFRSPVILFYFEDFSYKEIAEQMEVPVGTVMSRLARAKAYLRQRLTASQPAAVAHRRPAAPLSGSVSRSVPHARAP